MERGTCWGAQENPRGLRVSALSHLLGQPAKPSVLCDLLIAHEAGQWRLGIRAGRHGLFGIRFHLQIPLGRESTLRIVCVVPVRRLTATCDATGPAQRGKTRVTSIGKLAKLNCFTGTNRRSVPLQRLVSIASFILFSAAEPLLTIHAKRHRTHNSLHRSNLRRRSSFKH